MLVPWNRIRNGAGLYLQIYSLDDCVTVYSRTTMPSIRQSPKTNLYMYVALSGQKYIVFILIVILPKVNLHTYYQRHL